MTIHVDYKETSYKLEDGEMVCTHESVIVEQEEEGYLVYCANDDCGMEVEPGNIEDYISFKEDSIW